MESKNCKYCSKQLMDNEVSNDYTCTNCQQKNIQKLKNKGTLLFILGIVFLVLFIEMVLLTVFKSTFGGFSVTFLVIGIILAVLFFTIAVIMIVAGSLIFKHSQIIQKQIKKVNNGI